MFYDADAIEQLAINVFYGMGYNFYRLENQLRADDQMVRSRVCTSLNTARDRLEQAQSLYRKQFLPPPSRARPTPDPQALEAARTLESLSGAVGRLEGAIRTLPVPANDRMTQRYRDEAQTLDLLGQCDTLLVGQAEALRLTLEGKDHVWILANVAPIRDSLDAMTIRVQERQRLLQ